MTTSRARITWIASASGARQTRATPSVHAPASRRLHRRNHLQIPRNLLLHNRIRRNRYKIPHLRRYKISFLRYKISCFHIPLWSLDLSHSNPALRYKMTSTITSIVWHPRERKSFGKVPGGFRLHHE